MLMSDACNYMDNIDIDIDIDNIDNIIGHLAANVICS